MEDKLDWVELLAAHIAEEFHTGRLAQMAITESDIIAEPIVTLELTGFNDDEHLGAWLCGELAEPIGYR